jgi:RimJ/RimL family protein N-acetyltransferase
MTSLEISPKESAREESTAILKTERLVLRAPRPDDAKAITSLINDRRIAENTARIPHPYSLADAHAFLAETNRDARERSFLIALTEGTVIGGCGIDDLSGREPELGYWIGVSHWGRGYVTEAARALIDHVFGELGYERLTSRARVSNPAPAGCWRNAASNGPACP